MTRSGRGQRWAAAWIRGVLRRPGWTLVGVLALTALAAAGLPRLELRMDGRALVPPDDPVLAFDREVREVFGRRDPLVVLLENRRPEGLYDPELLRRLVAVTERAAELEGVRPEDVVSLATERRDRVYPGTLRFRPFLDPFPDSPQLLDVLAEDVAAVGILDGTLVSLDGSGAAVLVGVPDVEEVGDRAAFYRRLEELVAPLASPDIRITVVGAPAAEALLGRHILEDLALLLPLSLATMAVLLFVRLGRPWPVAVALAEVGLCLLATFGLMGWTGVPLSLTTSVLPVVLISLGLADEVHLFTHYRLLLDRGGEADARATIERTMAEMLPPIVLTSLTTSVGFLSFLASPIEPIRHFGLFAAAGILFCLLFSVTTVPAVLALLPAARFRSSGRRRARPDRLVALAAAPLRRPAATLLALALAVAAVAAGIHRLEVQDGWIDGFAPGSAFRADTERVDERLLGTHNLLVHLHARGDGSGAPPEGDGRAGWLLEPALLEEIGRFEEHLRSLDGVGGVLGPYGHLTTVAHLWHARKEGTRRIPDDPLTVARVYRFFEIVRGIERRREVVNDELDRALVNVFLEDADFRQTEAVIDGIRAWEDRLARQGVELSLAGDVAVSQAMIPAIVRSQVSSLSLALLGALVALTLLQRSLWTAVVSLAPVSAAVACVFGVMGWVGMPLGVATSMFCAITLGVGVDYAIHLTAAHRRAHAAGAAEPVAAAFDEAGPAILTDTGVICLSFAWLLVSRVPSNARLGLLVSVALGTACLLTLLGLGSAWRWRRQRRPLSLRAVSELESAVALEPLPPRPSGYPPAPAKRSFSNEL